ncbi:MAG TPA: glycine cleavage system protein GcvH, partial [Thermoanaerobaculia bacterium]
ELGDVVFVELPQVGTELEQGDEMGSIESVKAVSELFAPVSGEVVEVNEALAEKPELVNTDPYGDGWMIRVKLATPEEVDEMMDAEEYEEYVEKEAGK